MRHKICILLLALPLLASATAYTSSQIGNWSASTTWGSVGVPGNGDTVTINHAVTVDVNTIVGTSPVSGTNVITLGNVAAASLTIPTNIQLTVRGGLSLGAFSGSNSNTLTMGAGSILQLDASLAASPSTTNYSLLVAANGTVNVNGTAGNHCSIQSNVGGGNAIISTGGSAVLNIDVTYCDLIRIGTLSTGPFHNWSNTASGLHINISHNSFIACTGTIDFAIGENAASDLQFNYNDIDGYPVATSSLTWALTATATTGKREFKNNYVSGFLTFNNSNMANWVITGNIIYHIASGVPDNTGIFTGSNNTFIETLGGTATFDWSRVVGVMTDTALIFMNNNPNHQEGAFHPGANFTFNGGVQEHSFNVPGGSGWSSPAVYLTGATTVSQTQTYNNIINAVSAGGQASGFPLQMKGLNISHMTFAHNTEPMAWVGAGGIYAVYSGHGTNLCSWPGLFTAIKNNLWWSPNTPVTQFTYTVQDMEAIAGTAQTGSTSSTLIPNGIAWGTGTGAPLGMTVLMTSGTNIGLSEIITSCASGTSCTVGTPFPNSMLGQTYVIYGVNAIAAANNNAIQGAFAQGTLYDALNNVTQTNSVGYNLYHFDTPGRAAIGVNDIYPSYMQFVDTTRTIARFSIDYLGNAIATPWVTGTAYTIGQIVSYSHTGFYGGRTVNIRCIQAHTAGAVGSATEPLTFLSNVSGQTDNWRNYWEYESLYEIRRAQDQYPGYNPAATQAAYMAWMRQGYMPTNLALKGRADDGTDIGAVPMLRWAATGGIGASGAAF